MEKGFTLMELLAVMGMIGILSALLLPALSAAKTQARSTACKNHLRQMGQALQMYVNDHQGRYSRSWEYWWAQLRPYYVLEWTNAAYHCPGYKGLVTVAWEPWNLPKAFPMGSYAYNVWGIRTFVVSVHDPFRGVDLRFPNEDFGLAGLNGRSSTLESQVQAPSEMIALGESRFLNESVNHQPGGRTMLESGWLSWTTNSGVPKSFAFGLRHGKNYNVAFCDGHVAAMSPWLLFNPTNTARMWNYDHQPHPELWVPE
jgi:prepilin-type processing-associated H-X9-DG protein/prepilin-type N-terminal cleavage/methylation domain-containing protein